MINIICLPIAGIENPYQKLMMEGLTCDGKISVKHGVDGKFVAIIMTALKHNPDYIHFDWIHQYYLRRSNWITYLFYPLFVIQVLFVKYILRVKIVWTLHNIIPHDKAYFGPYRWARVFFASKCAWIRVFSYDTAEKAAILLNVPLEKFKVVPEGSYVGYYPDTITQKEARSYLNVEMNKRVFLFFGSMRPYKGIEDLINIYKRIRTDDTFLILAGKCLSHEYKDEIGKRVSGNNDILLHAFTIEVLDVQEYMNASDIVVLPYKKVENSGSAILAMGFKKPVVAPNIGVLPIRLKGQTELLYKDNLEQTLEMAIKISNDQLSAIGELNYKNLLNYKWNDFQSSFI